MAMLAGACPTVIGESEAGTNPLRPPNNKDRYVVVALIRNEQIQAFVIINISDRHTFRKVAYGNARLRKRFRNC